jgi:hypothetical protein
MDPRQTAELAAAIAALAGMVARTMGAAAGVGDSAAAGASTGDSAGSGATDDAGASDAAGAQGEPLPSPVERLRDLDSVVKSMAHDVRRDGQDSVDVPDEGSCLGDWADFASEYGGQTLHSREADLDDQLTELREQIAVVRDAIANVATVAAEVAARHPGDGGAAAVAAALRAS